MNNPIHRSAPRPPQPRPRVRRVLGERAPIRAAMQDPKTLPEWIQREADAIVAQERRQRIVAGVAASLLLGAMVLTLCALAMLPAELAELGPAPADVEQPIAP